MALRPAAVMSAFLSASHAEMLAYQRPTVPAPAAGPELVEGMLPSESTTIILSALSDTESTFHALLAESVNLSFLKMRARSVAPNAIVQVPFEFVVTDEAVTETLESAPMVYSLICRALESLTLPDPVVVVVAKVPLVKSPSEVFTTDAVLDAISKSSPPLTATISEEAEEYWLQAL